jgi:hypothetical protein
VNAAAAGILAALLAVRALEAATSVLNLRALRPEPPPELRDLYDRSSASSCTTPGATS